VRRFDSYRGHVDLKARFPGPHSKPLSRHPFELSRMFTMTRRNVVLAWTYSALNVTGSNPDDWDTSRGSFVGKASTPYSTSLMTSGRRVAAR
jgi:hypothetical protein